MLLCYIPNNCEPDGMHCKLACCMPLLLQILRPTAQKKTGNTISCTMSAAVMLGETKMEIFDSVISLEKTHI